MSAATQRCDQAGSVCAYALKILPASEVPQIQKHLGTCPECRHDLETLAPVVKSFAFWPTDVLRPSASLWERLAVRLTTEGVEVTTSPGAAQWSEPEWEAVAPGISCKLLATDADKDRVSMLVRLAPGHEYPPHRHSGLEELHLLEGELWINDRKLFAGEYNRAEPGTADTRVWTETGCTCVLITSTRDVLA